MDSGCFKTFQWQNPCDHTLTGATLIMEAHPHSDWIVSPSGTPPRLDAAFYYTESADDFILTATVSHPFAARYDACALAVVYDDTHWGKICYEYSDAATRCIATVITNGVSDEANGDDLDAASVRLRLMRKGDLFAMFFAQEDGSFKMARYFSMPALRPVKLGLIAQSPLGEGGVFTFDQIDLAFRTPHDIRRSGI